MRQAEAAPAKTFPEDVNRDIAALTDARVRLEADLDEERRDQARRGIRLRQAWEEFSEHYGRRAALEELGFAEGVRCPSAAEFFFEAGEQLEGLGI